MSFNEPVVLQPQATNTGGSGFLGTVRDLGFGFLNFKLTRDQIRANQFNQTGGGYDVAVDSGGDGTASEPSFLAKYGDWLVYGGLAVVALVAIRSWPK